MKREYYKKTKYGYARGTEPVSYIEKILVYYDILKRQAHGRKPRRVSASEEINDGTHG